MQFATGTVVDGKVIVQGASLPDGTVVAILARDANEEFDVPADLEAELDASLAEAQRGETISPDELFGRLLRSS
ncbi:MAG: hypothetical protein V4787_10360 [Pseudomonadota bacterium]